MSPKMSANGDGFDIGGSIFARFIRDQVRFFPGGNVKGSSPISSQIALWMPCGSRDVGGKRSTTRTWIPLQQELDRLFDEGAERRTRVFVPGRDDLDHCNNSPEMVADDDAVGTAGVDLVFRTMHDLRDGRFQQGRANRRLAQSTLRRPGFDRELSGSRGPDRCSTSADGPLR